MRIYKSGSEVILAACDAELLGRTLVEGKLRLFVDERFYGGDKVDEATVAKNLRLATMANLVGEGAVSAAVKAGYIDPDCVMRLEGVPHAQMVLMQ